MRTCSWCAIASRSKALECHAFPHRVGSDVRASSWQRFSVQNHVATRLSSIPIGQGKIGWWFQPIWKLYSSQIGSFPQIGVKIKNIWNHHPEKNRVSYDNCTSICYNIYTLELELITAAAGRVAVVVMVMVAARNPSRDTTLVVSVGVIGNTQTIYVWHM